MPEPLPDPLPRRTLTYDAARLQLDARLLRETITRKAIPVTRPTLDWLEARLTRRSCDDRAVAAGFKRRTP